MHVKALERLVASRGVNASKADGITRTLRQSGHLPLGGRGPNAPKIGVREAAILLIAIAGSSKAADAPRRVQKLMDLRSKARGSSLVQAVEALLSDPTARMNMREVRIARTRNRAVILHINNDADEFRNSKIPNGRFVVEGVLDRDFISSVADALAAKSAPSPLGADDD